MSVRPERANLGFAADDVFTGVHLVEKRLAREGALRVTEKNRKQRHILRREIEPERVHDQRLRRQLRRTADKRLHARRQFGDGEGLDHVVVGAGVEAAHPLVDLAERGEEERIDVRAGAQPSLGVIGDQERKQARTELAKIVARVAPVLSAPCIRNASASTAAISARATQGLKSNVPIVPSVSAKQAEAWSAVFEVAPTTNLVTAAALTIVRDHRFQVWDAVIWSAARAAGATLFISEV